MNRSLTASIQMFENGIAGATGGYAPVSFQTAAPVHLG